MSGVTLADCCLYAQYHFKLCRLYSLHALMGHALNQKHIFQLQLIAPVAQNRILAKLRSCCPIKNSSEYLTYLHFLHVLSCSENLLHIHKETVNQNSFQIFHQHINQQLDICNHFSIQCFSFYCHHIETVINEWETFDYTSSQGVQ